MAPDHTSPVEDDLAQLVVACRACRPWAAQDEGPYRRDDVEFRRDLVEDRDGVPLQLGVRLLGADGQPVTDAEVEIWQCDASGRYSGFPPPDPSVVVDSETAPRAEYLPEQTWLRGRQRTDRAGMVEFRTIYPGWYPGRAVHIHIVVSASGTTFTSQLYFPEGTTEKVFSQHPYDQRPGPDTTNVADTIFSTGEEPAVLDLVPVGDGFRAGACLILPEAPPRA